ncbi:MAG TPA: gliding motility-associated C-terminal domain-containing protein, partial [Chitinophagaceae bacterium]|nr:gliding motility-associated C-terminal domain-containing protein [Chitinophagaceae bacterium]
LAYYVFNGLENKQGDPRWDGILTGNASTGATNPACNTLGGENCCPVLTGTLTGNKACSGGKGTLVFTTNAGTGPYTLSLSDGNSTFDVPDVTSGQAFTLPVDPAATTTYTLLGIVDAAGCANTVAPVSATVEVNNCTLCTGSLGDPVVNITFGSGSGPAGNLQTVVPGASTTYEFLASSGNPATPTPHDGKYTISNNVPANPAWFEGAPDHTPGDQDGYLAFFNSSETPGVFYQQTVTGLCGNTKYEFAAWIANVLDLNRLNGQKPDLTFRIERPDGTLIASVATGPIEQSRSMTWKQYGAFFTTPAGIGTVGLKIINSNPGGASLPGNDLALDDITFRPCGAKAAASFSGGQVVTKKTICGVAAQTLYGSVTANDYAQPAYRWQVSTDNGTSWTDLANSDRISINYTPPATGTYLLRMLTAERSNIGSPSCRVASAGIELVVSGIPQGALTGQTICAGDPATVRFTATAGTGPFTIRYRVGGTELSRTGLISPASFPLLPAPASDVTVTLLSVTDANGCVRTSGFGGAADIVVRPLPVVVMSGNATICRKDSVQLTASGGDSYAWSPAAGLDNAGSDRPKAAPAATTTYQVTVTRNNCRATGQVVVTVNDLPRVTVNRDTAVCAGSIVRLQAGGGTQYRWSPAAGLSDPESANPLALPGQTTVYRVKVTNSAGCSDSVTTTLTIHPLPVLTLSADQQLCAGDSVRLSAAGGVTYQWQPATGLSSSTAAQPWASPATNTTYTAIAASAEGCRDTGRVTISLVPRPVLELGADRLLCLGDSYTLDATITGGQQYTWSHGATGPVLQVTTGGLYQVQATTGVCSVTDSIRLTQPPEATVRLGRDTSICNFNTIELKAQVTGATDYLWSNGSRESSIVANTEGTYTLTVRNACSEASDALFLKVDICADDLFLPNAFTPNGDGKNDTFRPAFFAGVTFYNYELTLYNRWGERVFFTRDINSGWNGLVQGKMQASETFIWIVRYRKTPTGPLLMRKGTMVLIR